ncbi:unnamed protein product [Nippostrongylus brasiliensis]|uniref:LTD domain-containing protein n=1 Tax=Nippostrongylus brasiliensis TaxID=27835 RepID=A0A158R0L8_NIPBR|nr:unnamed protein product [Nippostrongylus brasiliensis]
MVVILARLSEAVQIRLAENHEILPLNNRLAEYICEVHFLQAVQRKMELRIQQWSGSSGYRAERSSFAYVGSAARYEADIEQLPSLNLQLSSAESRLEAALQTVHHTDEDQLIAKLCDITKELNLAQWRGRRIEEECRRLRVENQRIIDDLAEQRLERLTALRAELHDLRTNLMNLENRNRLLESWIIDIEHARQSDLAIGEAVVRADELHLRSLMEQYEVLVSGPSPNEYSIATLREEIRRYRELLDGIGPSSHRGGAEFNFTIAGRYIQQKTSSSYYAGGAVSGGGYQTAIGSGVVAASSGASRSHVIGGVSTAYKQTKSSSMVHSGGAYSSGMGSGAVYLTGMDSGAGYQTQIGSGVVSQSHIGHIGGGATSAEYRNQSYSSSSHVVDHQPSVVSTLDYTINATPNEIIEQDYSMHRSALGNVTIGDISKDGGFIVIENTSVDSDQYLGGWTLGNANSAQFTFPQGYTLTPLSSVKIYARGQGFQNPPHTLVCESGSSTFATSDDLNIYLYDNDGQERAHVSQRQYFRGRRTF